MATKQEPVRRNDVIRCSKCGEDYSTTYKRCPFCDERPSRARTTGGGTSRSGGGRRVAGNARGGGYRGGVNPIQVAILVGSLVLIIAALYIVFNAVAPLLGQREPSGSQSSPSSSSSASASTPPASSAPEQLPPVDSTPDEPVVIAVNSIKLNKSDFTLQPNESHQIKATVDPGDAQVVWTSSNEAVATVSADGTVTNVNTGASKVTVTITATAGDKSAECLVRCNPGSSGSGSGAASGSGGLSIGSTGKVSGAASGLNVRSGPGSGYDVIASLNNGGEVKILDNADSGWYKVSFSGIGGVKTEGYVSKDYIR